MGLQARSSPVCYPADSHVKLKNTAELTAAVLESVPGDIKTISFSSFLLIPSSVEEKFVVLLHSLTEVQESLKRAFPVSSSKQGSGPGMAIECVSTECEIGFSLALCSMGADFSVGKGGFPLPIMGRLICTRSNVSCKNKVL